MLIDLEPELGVGAQVGRNALGMAVVTIDPVPAANPPAWTVSVRTPAATVTSHSTQDHATAQALYGKVVNKVNGGTPFNVAEAKAIDPNTAAEIRSVLLGGLMMAAVVVRGPNSQAYIAQLIAAVENPTTWNALLAILSGPVPAA